MRMKVLKVLKEVKCINTSGHEMPFAKYPCILRSQEGRLLLMGNYIDLLDLLLWVDENPLTQFRETATPAAFKPSEQFAHLFSPEGAVL